MQIPGITINILQLFIHEVCCIAGILFLSGQRINRRDTSIVTFRLAVRSKAKLCFYFIANFTAVGQSVNERKIEFRENFLKSPAESDVRGCKLDDLRLSI